MSVDTQVETAVKNLLQYMDCGDWNAPYDDLGDRILVQAVVDAVRAEETEKYAKLASDFHARARKHTEYGNLRDFPIPCVLEYQIMWWCANQLEQLTKGKP